MHIARNECPVSSAKCENSFRIYYEFPIFIPIKANICMNYWIYGWKSKESTNLKYSASFPGIYWNKCSISQGNRQSFINIYIYSSSKWIFDDTKSYVYVCESDDDCDDWSYHWIKK